jgi:hypothetical protein
MKIQWNRVFGVVVANCLLVGVACADEWFSAADTIREAGIGTYSPEYVESDSEEDETYQEPVLPKSETLLVNGRMVCFKLESGVSIAYYCN